MQLSSSVAAKRAGGAASKYFVPEPPAQFAGKCRGSIIRALIDTYESDHGESALGRLLADLSSESRLVCLHGILESAWYPQTVFVELASAAHLRLGPDGCVDLAFRSQRRHLQRLRRLVTRAEDPQALLPCAVKAWRRYQDTGRVRLHSVGPGYATMSVDGNPAVLEPGYAETVLGSMLALVRMAGATRVGGTVDRRPPAQTLLQLSWD